MMLKPRYQGGFTLIEVIIVVAILGIVATIAIPSYLNSVQSTRRAAAEADLLELAQFMERQYTSGYDYRQAGGGQPVLPFTDSSRGAGTVFYNYSFVNPVTRNNFTLQAVPASNQASDPCGTLTLDETGARGSAGGANCW
jgi:type IV pilus assembly protein PilE